MKFIVNGDDFGLTKGVNRGIIHAHEEGILMSTTMMVTMKYAKEAAELSKEYPNLGVGIHLTATAGGPLCKELKSLQNEKGNFYTHKDLRKGEIEYNREELYKEWESQMELFIEKMGKKPTHIDSHHHVHIYPNYSEVAKKLALKYDLPLRGLKYSKEERTSRTAMSFIGEGVSLEYFTKDKENILKDEVVDLMCHPAFLDDELTAISSYNITREQELNILTSDEIKEWVKENNIELVNYNYFR